MKTPSPPIIAAGAALAVLAYIVIRGPKDAAKDTASTATGAVIDLVDGALQGTVETTGEKLFGIPATDQDKCAAAQAAGQGFEVSKYCPAKQAIGYAVEWVKGLFK